MPIKKRILKNKNKYTFYKKKRMMKGGKDTNQYEENDEGESRYEPNHSGLLGVLQQAAGIFSMGANIIVDKVTKMLNLDLSQLKESSSSISTEQIKQILKDKITQTNYFFIKKYCLDLKLTLTMCKMNKIIAIAILAISHFAVAQKTIEMTQEKPNLPKTDKLVIYQIYTRLFGNLKTTNKFNGSIEGET